MGAPTLRSSKTGGSSLFIVKHPSTQVACSSGLIMSFQQNCHHLTLIQKGTRCLQVQHQVVKIETEALDFPEHSAPAEVNRGWC